MPLYLFFDPSTGDTSTSTVSWFGDPQLYTSRTAGPFDFVTQDLEFIHKCLAEATQGAACRVYAVMMNELFSQVVAEHYKTSVTAQLLKQGATVTWWSHRKGIEEGKAHPQ